MTTARHGPATPAPVALALALASAIIYGVSDYVGGRTSRRVSPLTLTLVAELTLLVVLVPTVPAFEDASSTMRAFGWGMAGGAAGSTGVLGLYAGLSRGNMTVVAPITGVVAATVPVDANPCPSSARKTSVWIAAAAETFGVRHSWGTTRSARS